MLSDKEKLDLKKLVNESDCENNTEYIRGLKHSSKILEGVCILQQLKKIKQHIMDETPQQTEDDFLERCKHESDFLFVHYPDIFHKVMKDEIDMRILSKLLRVLKMIEDGEVDQHEGSAMVGKTLKEMYVDSAIRHGDNLDKEHKHEKVKKDDGKNINWRQYKALQHFKGARDLV